MLGIVTVFHVVQHGEKERLPGDPRLTDLGRWQAVRTAVWRAGERFSGLSADWQEGRGRVWHAPTAGVTVNLLRTLAGDRALPARLLDKGIPPCAITTLDDEVITGIASVSHLQLKPGAGRRGHHAPLR
jgi:hypothetical protein